MAEGAPDIVDVLLSRCAFHVDGRPKRVEWDRDPPVLASPPGSRMVRRTRTKILAFHTCLFGVYTAGPPRCLTLSAFRDRLLGLWPGRRRTLSPLSRSREHHGHSSQQFGPATIGKRRLA